MRPITTFRAWLVLIVGNVFAIAGLAFWRIKAPIDRIADQGLVIAGFLFLIIFLYGWLCRLRDPQSNAGRHWTVVGMTAIASSTLFLQFGLGIPLNIERSRSFAVLQFLHLSQPIGEGELVGLISELGEDGDPAAMLQRIREQEERHLIRRNGEYLSLTTLGEGLVSVSDSVAWTFNLQRWQSRRAAS
jgi:hypothetical protein